MAQETKDYKIFHTKAGNRNLNRTHIDKLKDAISKHGYLASCPIIVNEKYEIIDGQHRFEACKEMGLPILFQIEENTSEDLLIDLNILQKKWTINDYISYHAKQKGNEHYIRLARIIEETKLDAVTLLELAMGREIGGSFINSVVKPGNLQLSKEEVHRAAIMYSRLNDLRIALRMKLTGRFCRAAVTLSRQEGFVWDTMIEKATKYSAKAYQCSTKQEYIEMLKNLYNHNVKTKKNLL